eukprot:Clim_evm11s151 gene=Clim_evmTU11s151
MAGGDGFTRNYTDDGGDDQLVGDLMAEKPSLDDPFESVIVLDQVPKVPEAKEKKLTTVLKNLCSNYGKVREDGIYMPRDPGSDLSKGYAFVEFQNASQAKAAISGLQGYKLDKKHTFEANHFTDIERFAKWPVDFQGVEREAYEPQDNPRWWLSDESARDQFVVRHDDMTSIYWHNTRDDPEGITQRLNWTETGVLWSPLGSYLATFHRQGIALWSGENWTQAGKFPHPGAKIIDFSPQENYLVTYSSEVVDEPGNPQSIIVWNIRTGEKMRAFPEGPVLKWSPDDKYFARLVPNEGIRIYETETFKLLDKKKLEVPGLQDFSWSPTDNIIAYWVPELDNNPARVVTMSIPSRQELRVKNLFNVHMAHMFWQKTGDYLCVKVDRFTKTKKTTYINLEIFRLREKQVPVDVLEVKENVIAFSWEPQGNRFCLISGEQTKTNVSFYAMEQTVSGGKITLLHTLEKKQLNHIFWSPKGQFVLLAGIRTMNGTLEFWDVDNLTSMAVEEHFMATDVEWDPTGRFVTTSVSQLRSKMENGFIIWTFQGNELQAKKFEKLWQVLWRPRPASLLNKDDVKKLKKNMKQYSQKFDRLDALAESHASKELIEKRRRLIEEYDAFRKAVEERRKSERQARIELRGGDLSDDEDDYVETEEVVETFIEKKVERLPAGGK